MITAKLYKEKKTVFGLRLFLVSLLLLTLVLGAAGCGKEAAPEEVLIPGVEVGLLQRITIDDVITGTGVVTARNVSEVAAAVSGIVTEIQAEEGDVVHEGDPLLRIDQTAYAAGYASAQAQVSSALENLEQQKRELERGQKLHERGYISEQELEQRRLAVKTAQATYDQAAANRDAQEANLEDAVVKAPFTGVVDERFVDAGEAASPQARLFRIVDLSELRLEVQFPQELAQRIRLGQLAEVMLQESERKYTGIVTRIGAQLDPQTRALPVEITLTNPDTIIRPGMYASVGVTVGKNENAAIVPKGGMLRKEGENRVFVVRHEEGEEHPAVEMRVVSVGDASVDGILITAGLEDLPEGTPIAISNLSGLSDGAMVRILEKEKAPSAESQEEAGAEELSAP